MKQKGIIVLCFILFLSTITAGQNLIPNPGFEQFNECPTNYSDFKTSPNIPFWFSPTKASPDYYNACSKYNVGIPNNFMGYLFAKEGNAYLGILLAEKPDRIQKGLGPFNEREYIQVKLQEQLEKDTLYVVSFYYSVAKYSMFAVNSIGACLSSKKMHGRKVLGCETIHINDTSVINNTTGEWLMMCDTIVAFGTEEYITIGSFLDDNIARFEKTDNSNIRQSIKQTMETNGYAYYLIDEVSVRKLND